MSTLGEPQLGSRYCPDCEREHLFSIGGHAYEPGPSGRCTYCGGRPEDHVTRTTTVVAVPDTFDGAGQRQTDDPSDTATTAAARASTAGAYKPVPPDKPGSQVGPSLGS